MTGATTPPLGGSNCVPLTCRHAVDTATSDEARAALTAMTRPATTREISRLILRARGCTHPRTNEPQLTPGRLAGLGQLVDLQEAICATTVQEYSASFGTHPPVPFTGPYYMSVAQALEHHKSAGPEHRAVTVASRMNGILTGMGLDPAASAKGARVSLDLAADDMRALMAELGVSL